MLSSKSVTAPALNLKPSRLLAAYTLCGHLMALCMLFYPMTIPISARLLIAGTVVVSLIYHWRKREPLQALRAPLNGDLWLLQLQDGSEVEASLYGEYTVTTWILVVRFKSREKGRFAVVVLPDSGDREEIRRMRVYLRQLKTATLK